MAAFHVNEINRRKEIVPVSYLLPMFLHPIANMKAETLFHDMMLLLQTVQVAVCLF